MEFLEYLRSIPAFFKDNPLLAAISAVILIFAIYRRPKLVITTFLMGLLAMGVLYLVLSMSSAGVQKKEKLIERSIVPEMETTLVQPLR